MQNGGWVELLRLVPGALHDRLILVTADGSELAVQDVVRLEPEYAVLRGRLAGTSDTGLTFFLPYDRIVFARFVKPLPEEMVYGLYGMKPPERKAVEAAAETGADGAHDGEASESSAAGEGATPAGGINRKELLDRLRNRLQRPGKHRPRPGFPGNGGGPAAPPR
jgi:hypothetical protein